MSKEQKESSGPGGQPMSLVRAVRYLAPFILPRWKTLTVAALALVTFVVFELAKPWPLKFVFDYLVKNVSFLPEWARVSWLGESEGGLFFVCALILATAAISSLAAFTREFLLNRVGEELAFEIRVKLFGHVQRLGLGFHDSSRLGDTITRITEDTRSIRDLASTSLLQVATAVVTIAFMLGTMLVMDWRLGLVGVVAVPVIGPTIWYFRRKIEKASRKRREREGELTSVAQETMSSIRLVKTLGREAQQQKAFGHESSESAQIGLRVARLEASYVRSMDFAVAAITCVVVWLGVHRVWAGALQAGDLYVFAYYVKNLYGPLRDLAKHSSKIAKGKVGLERVAELLATQVSVADAPDARPAARLKGRVAFEGVRFEYAPGNVALEDVSFRAEPGQVLALVGHSGAGKSTILSLLSRLYDPAAGRILLDGQDIKSFTLASLREQISVVLQDSLLLQTSIRENILYGRSDASEAEIRSAVSDAGVDLFIERLPDGYDTVVGQRGSSLSGGERQRVAIARALLRNAPILLLDEPTTGLDAKSEQVVMRALERLMEGRTTFLVSHKLGLVERAHKILVIDQGRIAESGTAAELMRARGLYAQLRAAGADSGMFGGEPLVGSRDPESAGSG